MILCAKAVSYFFSYTHYSTTLIIQNYQHNLPQLGYIIFFLFYWFYKYEGGIFIVSCSQTRSNLAYADRSRANRHAPHFTLVQLQPLLPDYNRTHRIRSSHHPYDSPSIRSPPTLPSEACRKRAFFRISGSSLPLRSALFRIPRQALADRLYFGSALLSKMDVRQDLTGSVPFVVHNKG